MTKKFVKSLIVIILINGFLVAGWFWFFNKVKSSQEKSAQLQKEISENESRIKNLNVLEKTLEELARERQAIEKAVVAEKDLVGFIEFLESLAEKNNVELTIGSAVLPQKTEKQEEVLSFSLNLAGSFAALAGFNILLENSPFGVNVEAGQIRKLSLDEKKSKKTNKDWEAVFKINVLNYL